MALDPKVAQQMANEMKMKIKELDDAIAILQHSRDRINEMFDELLSKV